MLVGELRRPAGEPAVKRWVSRRPAEDLHISVITVIEAELGVLGLERKDPPQGRVLREWFESRLLPGFAGRILPLDLEAARRVVAPLHVPDRAPAHDALIAGTALAHGLTLVTRNTADFARAGVPLIDPWDAA
jgi:predicted nucleic acid-binding protein